MIPSDNWDQNQYQFSKLPFGKWELTIPANPDGSCVIPHNSKIKVNTNQSLCSHLLKFHCSGKFHFVNLKPNNRKVVTIFFQRDFHCNLFILAKS